MKNKTKLIHASVLLLIGIFVNNYAASTEQIHETTIHDPRTQLVSPANTPTPQEKYHMFNTFFALCHTPKPTRLKPTTLTPNTKRNFSTFIENLVIACNIAPKIQILAYEYTPELASSIMHLHGKSKTTLLSFINQVKSLPTISFSENELKLKHFLHTQLEVIRYAQDQEIQSLLAK